MERNNGQKRNCNIEGYTFELDNKRVAFPDHGTYSNEFQVDACIVTHPIPAQLKSLPWSNKTDIGIFAWCTEANGKQDSIENTVYVYSGSASKYLLWPREFIYTRPLNINNLC